MAAPIKKGATRAPEISLGLFSEDAVNKRHRRHFRRNAPLHRSEQVLTASQSFRHFFRQAKCRPQARQIFWGRLGFL
jgi:hypothetical protein